MKTIEINKILYICAPNEGSSRIGYMFFPNVEGLDTSWVSEAAGKYGISLVLGLIPLDNWQNLLSPWPEPGEEKGWASFAGKAPVFLRSIQTEVIPKVEKEMGLSNITERNLLGDSMSGLFALWQWMICDTFKSIASVSGSFWYIGFIEWFKSQAVPEGKGKAFFTLGDKEPGTKVPLYSSVRQNTMEIVKRLQDNGIDARFESVPGNHFSNPRKRVELALEALYGTND